MSNFGGDGPEWWHRLPRQDQSKSAKRARKTPYLFMLFLVALVLLAVWVIA